MYQGILRLVQNRCIEEQNVLGNTWKGKNVVDFLYWWYRKEFTYNFLFILFTSI